MPVYNSMIPEVIKMVSGTLALKNGYYYAVLSYRDAAGKRHQKWVSTGLPQKVISAGQNRSLFVFAANLRFLGLPEN